jgi:hypothetical protein
VQRLLDPLRVEVESYVPRRNPYSYQGTGGPWKVEELHRAFAMADVIEVGSTEYRRTTAFFSLGVGAIPAPMVGSTVAALPEALLTPGAGEGETSFLKVTKVGLLNRKGAFGRLAIELAL